MLKRGSEGIFICVLYNSTPHFVYLLPSICPLIGCSFSWSPFYLIRIFELVEQRPRRGQSPVEHRGNLSIRPSVHPSVHPSFCLPSVQDALLFKFSLNTMEKWHKAVYGQWYPGPYCIVCRLSWGRSWPGSGSLRPESETQRPISWSQRQGFQSLRPGFGPLRLGFRSLRPEPRSWRSESGSQRSGSGSLRLWCGFLEPEYKFKGPRL